MVKAPSANIAAQIASLNAKVTLMLVIGGAAIAGGAYAAWEVKTDIGELKYAIGYADGAAGSDSVLGQLKAINDTLKTLKAAPPGTDASPSPLEQRSALQP